MIWFDEKIHLVDKTLVGRAVFFNGLYVINNIKVFSNTIWSLWGYWIQRSSMWVKFRSLFLFPALLTSKYLSHNFNFYDVFLTLMLTSRFIRLFWPELKWLYNQQFLYRHVIIHFWFQTNNMRLWSMCL